jgi:surfeit locus 1 family protein
MTAARGRSRTGLAVPVLFVFAAVATFIALGTWQLERKAWKETLIATLDRRLAAGPVPLPPRQLWAKLDPADNEFRRVSFSAGFIPGTQALVYTAGSTVRTEMLGSGYWVFALARIAGGDLIAINLGFVPEGHKDAETLADVGDSIDMVGLMRWPEARGYFTPKDDSTHNLWFVRDHLAIAAAKGWPERGGQLAPFFIELERATPADGLPRPATVGVNLRNAHLQYAITWYGLAGVVTIMFVLWLRERGPA